MKNVKKIGAVLIAVILTVSALVFASVATDDITYTGTLADFNALVDAVPEFGTTAEKEAALNTATAYLSDSPVDPAGEGYGAVIEKYKAKMASLAALYVDESVASTGADVKAERMTLADKWAALAFATDEEKASDAAKALYEKIHAENLAIAKLYYAAIDIENIDAPNVPGVGNAAAAVAAAQVKAMRNYVENHTFDLSSDGYRAFASDYNAVVAQASAAKQRRYDAMVRDASLGEYELGTVLSYDFENVKHKIAAKNASGVDGNGNTFSNFVGTEQQIVGIDASGNEIKNSYFTLRYLGARNVSTGGILSTYLNPSYGAATSGMVIDFDITTFDELPTGGIVFQPYSGSSWMGISADGDLYGYNGSKEKLPYVEGAIVKGEWSHITYIYKPNDREKCELYLDYVFLGYVHGDTGNKGTVASALRMGNTASASGSFSLDNVACIRGTAFRNESYITSMTDPELLVYYSSYMQEDAFSLSDRIKAYEGVKKVIGDYAQINLETGEPERDEETGEIIYKPFPPDMKVGADELKTAIASYIDYDRESFVTEYKKVNLHTLREMIDVLVAYAPAPTKESLAERNAQIAAINTFITKNELYIYDDSEEPAPKPDYNYCITELGRVTVDVAADTPIYQFITAMTAFRNSTAVNFLIAKYEEAKTIIENGVDLNLRFEVGYEEFLDYYENEYLNAEEKLAYSKRLLNSKKYVNSVDYILGVYPTASQWKLYPVVRADKDWTAEDINALNERFGTSVVAPALEWTDTAVAKLNEELEHDLLEGWTDEMISANAQTYDYIFDYVIVIRGYLGAGIEENYPGYTVARDKIEALMSHYYAVLQLDHADVIREQLDLFVKSDTFIEKQGILSYIERYISANDVDPTNSNIAELLVRYDTYKNDLPPQEDDYAELLAQNTVYFINISNQFNSAITYAQKRELYDRATTYYYLMNVGSPEAQAAVALYDALTLELKAIEDASAGLIEAVMLLPTARDADTYFGYLVDAALCYKLADASIEGAANAIKVYEAARDAYNLKVNTDNAQIKECGDALGSLRANCGLSEIISVIIAKLYSF